jgi:DNA-binding MarR family transcriptional regulator
VYLGGRPAVIHADPGEQTADLEPGREHDAVRIFSMGMGIAVDHAVTARMAYKLAPKRGVGTRLPFRPAAVEAVPDDRRAVETRVYCHRPGVHGRSLSTMRQTGRHLSADELSAWRGFLRVHSALFHELDAELTAAHQLPLRSYEVLLLLEDAPGRRLRMTDLSRSVLLSPSGVTRLVDRLEREGLVDRERCPEDGRGYYAVLTKAGDRRLQDARSTHLAGVRRLFLDQLTDAELGRLAGYWDRLVPGAAGTDAEWRRAAPATPAAGCGDAGDA